MNRLLMSISVSAAMAMSCITASAQTRIMVISDPHVLSSEVEKADYNTCGKLDQYSYEIFNKAIDNVIQAKPNLLLVCGDLTYNGEKSSHEQAYSLLSRAKSAGVPVLVIPGNHDILNPNSIDEGKANINAADFKEKYYTDLCFGGYTEYESGDFTTKNVIYDPNSLSWATLVNDKLAIIGLDANIYGGSKYYSDGCLRKSTIAWMQNLVNTTFKGKMVIGMVHQEIMEHFSMSTPVSTFTQTNFAPTSILNVNYTYNPVDGTAADALTTEQVQQAFADAGIHYVLTGHFHVHSAVSKTVTKTDGTTATLQDISTGGLSTYPCWMRTLVVDEDAATVTSTSSLVEMPYKENGEEISDLQTKANTTVESLDDKYPILKNTFGVGIPFFITTLMKSESYELYDGTEVAQFTVTNGTRTETSYKFPSVTYTRSFKNNAWQALYVPFASTYSDWSENFDVAIPDEASMGMIHFKTLTASADDVPANTAVLVRLKSGKATGTYSVNVSGTVAMEPEMNATTYDNVGYTLEGTYSGLTGTEMTGKYALGGGMLKTVASEMTSPESIYLKPMRWYLDVTSSSSAKPASVNIYFDDDQEPTSIDLTDAESAVNGSVYRIDGTRVNNNGCMPHGLYIINGKVVAK